MEVTEAKRQGSRREDVAERSRRRGLDRRNTNRQRGRARATSVWANAKSKIHQDASTRAGRHGPRVVGLTRGDLRCESIEESAEVVVVKKAGETRKERRTEGTRGKLYGALRWAQNPPRRQPEQ